MMVRRYIAKTMPEAVTRIRQDLGKDAVILSSKRIYVKKWKGLWRTPRIEVMAAVGASGPSSSLVSLDQRKQSVVAERHIHAKSPEGNGSNEEEGNGSQFVAADLSHLRAEMAELKKMMEQKFITGNGTNQVPVSLAKEPLFDGWQKLSDKLCRQGMSKEWAVRLVDGCAEEVSRASLVVDLPITEDEALQRVFESYVIKQLHQSRASMPISNNARVVALVGPTGVGKTTTIAKLAALQVLSGTRKVGLVTMDTFRIAAIEQLKTYAGILNVPLEVAHQPSDLELCLTRLSDCDLIFVDTAGRNYVGTGFVEDINNLLLSQLIDEVYLVLSMTSKREDLESIVESFDGVQVDKYLFTKMDETSTFGPIVELLLKYDKPLSYHTTGQNVPDDIEVASLSQLVHGVVFGGPDQ